MPWPWYLLLNIFLSSSGGCSTVTASSRGARTFCVVQPGLAFLVLVSPKVLAIALDHRDLLIVSCDAFPQIARADFTFVQDGQIKTAATARMEPFRHVRTSESYTKFVARHARLRHLDHRFPDAELIADVDRLFVQPLRSKVLAEHSVRQQQVGKFCLPERIIFRGIDIHRLIPPAVDGQVRLLITVEIELIQHDAAGHRLFIDTGGHRLSVPLHRARTSDLY